MSAGPQTRGDCEELDRDDPLAHLRAEFAVVDGQIYLDGNSLGLMPKRVLPALEGFMEAWAYHGIRAWLEHDWIGLPQRTGAAIARLIGADPTEVIVADSTSINLFKAVAAAGALRPSRTVILTENGNFPTDGYVLQGLVKLVGDASILRMVERERVLAGLDSTVAVLVLTHVHYKTGEIFDLVEMTRAAHECGALVVWDLSHSAGAVPVDLHACRADLAVGCTYKFLNGGPGAPAYLFCARALQAHAQPLLTGWMGHRAPFEFLDDYAPAEGMKRHLTGTPAAMSLAVLAAALELFEGIDLQALWRKSRLLGDVFLQCLAAGNSHAELAVACPPVDRERGSQVSFRHPEGYAIIQALIRRGVIADFRAPDILRFGLAPLYTRYVDVYDAVEHLRAVIENREWDAPAFKRRAAIT